MALDITKKLDRNSLRLKGSDYSQPGAYFVTICTDNRICYFGNIVDGIMISFPISEIVREIWLGIPERFKYVDLDSFIIMPNHVHGVFIINKEYRDLIHQRCKVNREAKSSKGLIHQTQKDDSFFCRSLIFQTRKNSCPNKQTMAFISQPPKKTKNWILTKDYNKTAGKIIRYFKAKSAEIIHDNCFHLFKWQRNYYEHFVRSAKELNAIREYIINNQVKWALDRENCLSKNFNMDLDKYFKDVFKK